MRFYRVSYSQEGGNSAGFSWHTNLRDAETAKKADYDLKPEEYEVHDPTDDRIDVIDIKPTKAGILAAMKRYASHNDNG